MTFKEPLELPILFNSNEAHTLNELGIASTGIMPEKRIVTFYEIAHMFPYYDDRYKDPLTCIVSSHCEYLTDIPLTEVKRLISEL